MDLFNKEFCCKREKVKTCIILERFSVGVRAKIGFDIKTPCINLHLCYFFFFEDMSLVNECPTNVTETAAASKRLECVNDKYGNNQYICVPNEEKTSLVEFCYDGIMGIQEKGR